MLAPGVRPSLRRCRLPLATGTIVALALALPMALAIGYAAVMVRRQLNLRGLWGLPPSVSPSFGVTRRRRQMTVGGVLCKRGDGGGGGGVHKYGGAGTTVAEALQSQWCYGEASVV